MVLTRQQSVFPQTRAAAPANTDTTVIPTTSTEATRIPIEPDKTNDLNRLVSRAEALARMTFELNMRRLEAQVNDLQRDVSEVVRATAADREFRSLYETRLSNLWGEMVAVRQQVAKVEETATTQTQPSQQFENQQGAELALEACQTETRDLVSELRGEVADLRGLVDSLSQQMVSLSSTDAEADELVQSMTATPPTSNDNTQVSFSGSDSGVWDSDQKKKSTISSGTRIDEAIRSTKRWNRDHKSTALTDAAFCAGYLKQQSKRDAALAAYLQRCIARRVRRRPAEAGKPRPRTLEDFCQLVSWQDVLETAQDVLMRNRQETMGYLDGQGITL